jgi:hypothetical protein
VNVITGEPTCDGSIVIKRLIPGINGHGRLLVSALIFLACTGAGYLAIARLLGAGFVRFDSRLLSPAVLGSVAVLLLVYYVADGLRLYYALRTMGSHVPFRAMMRLVFINLFFSNITPMATGGGVAQIYFMRRHGVPVGIATAATTARTVFAALMIFGGSLVFIAARPRLEQAGVLNGSWGYIGGFVGIYLAGFIALILRPNWFLRPVLTLLAGISQTRMMQRQRAQRWMRSLSREMRRFSLAFTDFLNGHPRDIALTLVFTVVFLLCLFSFSIVLLWGLGYDVPMTTILGLQLVTTLVMYFSPTPGASGIAEGLYGQLFSGLITANHIVLVTLAWRFLTVHLGMVIGIFFVNREFLRASTTYAEDQ